MTDLDSTRAEERRNHGDDIDCQLKLKKLCDAVVDISTPHDRLHDTREVIVR